MVRIPMRKNADEVVGERSKPRRRKWLVLVLVTATGVGWKTRALISRFVVSRRPTSGANESPPIQPAGPSHQPSAAGPANGKPTDGGAMPATTGSEPRFDEAASPHDTELAEPTPASGAGQRSDSVDMGPANEAAAARATEPSVAPVIEGVDPTSKNDNALEGLAPVDGATHDGGSAGEGESGELGLIPRDLGQGSQTITEDVPSRLDATPGWVRGDGSADCPASHPLKGNGSSRIFHRPGESSYAVTIPEFCFATEDDATAAGFRPRAR